MFNKKPKALRAPEDVDIYTPLYDIPEDETWLFVVTDWDVSGINGPDDIYIKTAVRNRYFAVGSSSGRSYKSLDEGVKHAWEMLSNEAAQTPQHSAEVHIYRVFYYQEGTRARFKDNLLDYYRMKEARAAQDDELNSPT